MADRPDPYVPKKPGDVIQSGAWNELQVRTREEIRSHAHQGGEDGVLIPREGIEEKAIDGSRIDSEAAITVKTLEVAGTASAKTFAGNSATLQDSLEVTGTVQAGNFVGNGAVPRGVIVMWSGKENEIPPGWALCNGQHGTPNLRGRFIAGAGGENADYQPGDYGEPDSHKHEINIPPLIDIRTNVTGAHQHRNPREGAKSGSGSNFPKHEYTQSAGDHSHVINISYPLFKSEGTLSPNPNRPKWYALCFIMKL